MKKLILLLTLLSTTLFGQSWNLNGNSVESIQWLGTSNNYGFPIRTNNSEVARFTADGKFGIGTSSPAYMLDVNGKVRSSGQLAVNGGMDETFAFTITGKTSSGTTGGAIRIVNSNSSEIFRLLNDHKWCFYDEAGLGKYSRLELGSTGDVDARIYVRGWDNLGTHFGLWITDAQEEVKNFVVANNGHIYMGNLPSSPTGLNTGELWIDRTDGLNILKVK